MEHVVYVIGAGFSAVAELPVMSNFLEKAKDIYFSNREEYEHFGPVFEYINELSYIKNYYNADLHNIEEILSIIEMGETVGDKKSVEFRRFIKDTIEYYTPKNEQFSIYNRNQNNLIATDKNLKKYAAFTLALTNTKINVVGVSNDQNEKGYRLDYSPNNAESHSYTIITLNYDRLLEAVFDFTKQQDVDFYQTNPIQDQLFDLPIYKLHGTIDQEIIPPTWNKALGKDLSNAWQGAHNALENANHIRFLGYSMPESDSYLKYLFKSAIVGNEHLKSIDVIDLDSSGKVEENYRKFINWNKMRYRSANLNEYLVPFSRHWSNSNIDLQKLKNTREPFYYDICEQVHSGFMNGKHNR